MNNALANIIIRQIKFKYTPTADRTDSWDDMFWYGKKVPMTINDDGCLTRSHDQ